MNSMCQMPALDPDSGPKVKEGGNMKNILVVTSSKQVQCILDKPGDQHLRLRG
jgi:uncharacterized Zn ribbon protein